MYFQKPWRPEGSGKHFQSAKRLATKIFISRKFYVLQNKREIKIFQDKEKPNLSLAYLPAL